MPESRSKIDRPPAIILCGGSSRRMGTNKANLPFGPGTVLQYVINQFRRFAQPVAIVVGRTGTPPPVGQYVTLLRDENQYCGPLEGLRVGLEHFSQHEAIFVGTCDAPLVQAGVYRMMLEKLGDYDSVAPSIDGYLYPLTAVYRTRILEEIGQRVAQRQLRLHDLFDKISARKLGKADLLQLDPQLNTIKNMNTPVEYRELLKQIDFGDGSIPPAH